jgi:hypothetical protein
MDVYIPNDKNNAFRSPFLETKLSSGPFNAFSSSESEDLPFLADVFSAHFQWVETQRTTLSLHIFSHSITLTEINKTLT